MASLCFLVGQPSSGICSCTLTPGRELAAATLIPRGQPCTRMLLCSSGIPGQQDKAWALLCLGGGSGGD